MLTWANFYLFCFGFGFFFSLVAALSGHLHLDFGDADNLSAGADADHHHHHAPPWLNLGTIAAFLAWFGGTGWLITRLYKVWVVTTLGAALAAGTAGGYLVYVFLARVLMRGPEEMNPADYDMLGVLGTVSGRIRENGIGEIVFRRDGSRHSVAARSEDGRAIGDGEEVVVTKYDGGIAYVRRFDELL